MAAHALRGCVSSGVRAPEAALRGRRSVSARAEPLAAAVPTRLSLRPLARRKGTEEGTEHNQEEKAEAPAAQAAFKLRAPPSSQSLGDYLLKLLHKRVRKAQKLQRTALSESEASEHGDVAGDEAIRELRLVLRRLRNTLTIAQSVLELPAAAAPQRLSSTLRFLGVPRDAEAVASTLRSASATYDDVGDADGLLGPERAHLQSVLAQLDEARAAGLKEALASLSCRKVRRVLSALSRVEQRPRVRPFGRRDDMDAAVRDMIHSASVLFVHPSWELFSLARLPDGASRRHQEHWEQLLEVDAHRCEQLHSLRKAIREQRYLMEAYKALYKAPERDQDSFMKQVDTLISLQTHIGTLHDIQVVVTMLGPHAEQRFPKTLQALRRRFQDAWAAFQEGREAMVAVAGQRAFYSSILGFGVNLLDAVELS